MEISRDEFIDRFAISIGVHSLKLWNARSKQPPLYVSRSMHEVIGTNGGKMQLRSVAFGAIVAPVIEELHKKLPRGQKPERSELAGLVYDALTKAGIQVVREPHYYGHGGAAVNRM